MAHTCTQKGIFSLFKGKIHTHTLFKRDNGALMDDRHEMMRNSYYTNQYLETIMDYYPREKVRMNNLIDKNLFITCRIPAAVNGENCE